MYSLTIRMTARGDDTPQKTTSIVFEADNWEQLVGLAQSSDTILGIAALDVVREAQWRMAELLKQAAGVMMLPACRDALSLEPTTQNPKNLVGQRAARLTQTRGRGAPAGGE